MRVEAGPHEIFSLAHRFRRKILGRVLHLEYLTGLELGDKPPKLRRKRA